MLYQFLVVIGVVACVTKAIEQAIAQTSRRVAGKPSEQLCGIAGIGQVTRASLLAYLPELDN